MPSKCEAGSQECCKDLANTKLDLRNAANSLQIEGKGGATWGPSTVPLPPCGVVGVWHCLPPSPCGVVGVWYGMLGMYGVYGRSGMACLESMVCLMFGMYGRYGMYGMSGCYCMDGRYGM